MSILIKNVVIVDAGGQRRGKVLIEGDKIKKVYKEKGQVKTAYDREIDGKGRVLMPGFVDMHCHLRDPGLTDKEDMDSGMHAALKGGFTTLVAMANTKPIIDSAALLQANLDKAKGLNLCRLIQVCALTKGFSDADLVDFETTRPLTPIYSNDGYNVDNVKTMVAGLKASQKYDFILATHCEPETETVERDTALLKKNKGHLHVCHISRANTLNAIGAAKAKKLDITCEVTPHHLYASGLEYRVHPPFRTWPDRQALIEGARNGLIDICGTDHAPHSREDKLSGAPGINNFETAFGMYHTVFKGADIPLTRLSEMMSLAPAKRLGLTAGLIKEKYPADLVLVDPEADVRIDPKTFVSKSKNTPFAGEWLKGQILMTMVGGCVRYDHGSFI